MPVLWGSWGPEILCKAVLAPGAHPLVVTQSRKQWLPWAKNLFSSVPEICFSHAVSIFGDQPFTSLKDLCCLLSFEPLQNNVCVLQKGRVKDVFLLLGAMSPSCWKDVFCRLGQSGLHLWRAGSCLKFLSVCLSLCKVTDARINLC